MSSGERGADEGCCPVCGLVTVRDGAARTRCGECGWIMWGGLVAGAPSPDDETEFAALLDEASWRRDQLAVEQVAFADDRVGPLERDRLQLLVRGGPRDEPAEQAVLKEAAAERDAAAAAPVPWSALRGAVADLVRGGTAAVVVLELGTTGIGTVGLDVADDGTVRVGDTVVREWGRLVRSLPTGEAAGFVLAGGVGAATVPAFDRDALPALLDELPDRLWAPDTRLVVVRRVAGWRLIDRLARAIGSRGHVVGDVVLARAGEGAAALAWELASTAPARDGYHLVVVSAASGGAVELSAVELFAPGTVPDERARRVLTLHPPPYPTDELLLPLVRDDPRQPTTWVPVATHATARPAGAVDVTFTLSRSGQPRVTAPQTRLVDGPSPTAASLPVAARTGNLDLACVVELGGPTDRVGVRLTRVRRLVDAVRRAHPLPGGLRIGLVGYADHDPAWRAFDGPEHVVTHVVPLAEPPAVAAELVLWEADGRWEHPGVAAVEDALHAVAAAGPSFGWRSHARRLAVVIAARPPHPAPADARGGLPRCREGIDWTGTGPALSQLGVGVLALVEPGGTDAAGTHAATAWPTIAAAGVAVGADGEGWDDASLRLLHDHGLVLGPDESYPALAALAPAEGGR